MVKRGLSDQGSDLVDVATKRSTGDQPVVGGHLDDLPDVLTVAEVATVLRVGLSTAYALIEQRRLRAIRLGRRIVVPKSSVAALLAPGGNERR